MKLTIIKINEMVYSGDFDRVSIPTTDGNIEILPGHAAYMAGLKNGQLKYVVEGEEKILDIEKGFVEINKLEVLIIL